MKHTLSYCTSVAAPPSQRHPEACGTRRTSTAVSRSAFLALAACTLCADALADELYVTRTDQPTAATAPTPSGPTVAGVQPRNSTPLVCFQLSLQCMGRAPVPTSPYATVSVQTTATPQPTRGGSRSSSDMGKGTRLKLQAPDVTHVVPQEELQQPLATPEQQEQQQDSQTVDVRGTTDAPQVPGGLASLWWAILHPSQAWRVVAPAQ